MKTAHVAIPAVDVWRQVNQWAALNGLTVSNSNETSGVLQLSGSFASHPEWFTCAHRGAGIRDKQEYVLSFAITSRGPASSDVLVQAVGKETWHQHHRIAFWHYGHVWNYVDCPSTGVLEFARLHELTAN